MVVMWLLQGSGSGGRGVVKLVAPSELESRTLYDSECECYIEYDENSNIDIWKLHESVWRLLQIGSQIGL